MYDIPMFKIIIFGDEGPGKTTFIQRYLTSLFVSDQTMIIGVDFYLKSVSVDGEKVKLQVWVLSGESRFRFYHSNYVRGARGGLFLYDVTDRSSIARLDDWLRLIKNGLTKGVKIPILVVGIVTDEKSKRRVSAEEGLKIAKSRNLNGYIECNLKTGKNIEKAFEVLTRLILAAIK